MEIENLRQNDEIEQLNENYLQISSQVTNLSDDLITGLNSVRSKSTLINMNDLSQDVKEAMTGNSVAVVGVGAIQNDNIVNNTIKQSKMSDAILSEYGNLIDYDKCSFSMNLDDSGKEISSEYRDVSDYIPILGENYVVGNNNAYEIFYFDIDKVYISKQFPNTSNLVDLTIPEGARYFRVTMYKSTFENYGLYPYVAINKDKYLGTYSGIAGTPTITAPLYTKNDIILTDNNIKNYSISQKKLETNIINAINKNPDYELTNMGNLFDDRLIMKDVAFTTIDIEDFVKVGGFITSYYLNINIAHQYQCFTYGGYYIKWFNESYQLISVDSLLGNKTFTPPIGAKYAKISGELKNIEDKSSSNYLQFVDKSVNILNGMNQIVNPVYKANYLFTETTQLYPELSNKKMIFFGDSWCAGNTSYPGGWASYIRANTYNTICDNKGQNGSTWAQCYNNYLSPSKIAELDVNYDIVCIEAFTNGLYTADPYKTIGKVNTTLFNSIDEINTQMTDTICRDIELCLFQLSHYYEGKRICIIFPYQSRSQAYNNACFKNTIPLVKQIAQKYSIKVFDDFYTSNIPIFDRKYFWDEGEETEEEKIGTHLNQLSYPIIGKNIIEHLNNWA